MTESHYSILALDIETGPGDLELPAPVVRYGNTKDPEKRAEKEREAVAEQRELVALDPNYGRVISCHFAAITTAGNRSVWSAVRKDPAEPPDDPVVAIEERDDAERHLLNYIGTVIRRARKLVTFNGAAFDIPYLLRRACLLGADPLPPVEVNKYRCLHAGERHVDLYLVLTEHEPGNPLSLRRRLADYVQLILHEEHPDEYRDKNAYADWFASGNFDALRAAGEWDAEQTLALAERVLVYYQ